MGVMIGIFSPKRGLFEADSLMQIVGKINRDADYEYSETTPPQGSGGFARGNSPMRPRGVWGDLSTWTSLRFASIDAPRAVAASYSTGSSSTSCCWTLRPRRPSRLRALRRRLTTTLTIWRLGAATTYRSRLS